MSNIIVRKVDGEFSKFSIGFWFEDDIDNVDPEWIELIKCNDAMEVLQWFHYIYGGTK
jgi:hypothetical protein